MAEERTRRSQSRGSLGSRTSQRDPRMDPRSEYRFEQHHEYRTGEFRDSLDARGGYRDVEHARDRPAGSMPPYNRDPFPERDGYFRGGEPRGVGGPVPGFDRSTGRIEIDVTRPPPPLPFRGGHGYEPERIGAREPVESRDYDWHSGRGYRGPNRPPNWERSEGPPRDDWEPR